jgi:hypothetical protein
MAYKAGAKELKTDWDELTASDETKYVGHEQTLRPTEADKTYLRDRVGID